MAKKSGKPLTAIVGGNTLIGREIQEVVNDQKLLFRLELLDGELTGGTLSIKEDEAVFLPPVTKQTLAEASVVMLAGLPSSHEHSISSAPAGASLIDLTGALEGRPEAALRAPAAEKDKPKHKKLSIIAHPAAIAIAQMLRLLHVAGKIERGVILVLEPASERGYGGIGELDKQTRSLLALQPLAQATFDAQLAFNLLPEYGSEAPAKLEDVEARLTRHLEELLDAAIPMPSVRLVQAPVFHGYSMQVWVEFAEPADPEKVDRILRAAGVDVRDKDTEPATNVSAAQQSGLIAGSIRADRNNHRALWLWMVCDNLRVTAENALAVAQEGL